MKKLIAIDDGHGMKTSGKRTPKFKDGTFMHENDFNRGVVRYLDVELKRCGFDTIQVAPTDEDTPLSNRVNKANSVGANLYVSVHANANMGYWGNWGGIETYHYPTSKNGKKLAQIVHKYLLQGTKLKDRGVKSANFYVLRKTSMPSILVECGFMDNKEEAKLLMSEEYRKECAIEIAKGICEYFGVAYKQEIKQEKPKEDGEYVEVEGKRVKVVDINGEKYIPLRELFEETIKPKPTPQGKSEYVANGKMHYIKTKPNNIEIKILGDTLKGNNGINGTFFDVKDPKSTNKVWGICANDRQWVGNSYNATHSWRGYPQSVIAYYTDGTLGLEKVKNLGEFSKAVNWCVGGVGINPASEGFSGRYADVLRKCNHTILGYDRDGYVYLIVIKDCSMDEIKRCVGGLSLSNYILLDGGGSTQLNYEGKGVKSTRRINTAILLKEK